MPSSRVGSLPGPVRAARTPARVAAPQGPEETPRRPSRPRHAAAAASVTATAASHPSRQHRPGRARDGAAVQAGHQVARCSTVTGAPATEAGQHAGGGVRLHGRAAPGVATAAGGSARPPPGPASRPRPAPRPGPVPLRADHRPRRAACRSPRRSMPGPARTRPRPCPGPAARRACPRRRTAARGCDRAVVVAVGPYDLGALGAIGVRGSPASSRLARTPSPSDPASAPCARRPARGCRRSRSPDAARSPQRPSAAPARSVLAPVRSLISAGDRPRGAEDLERREPQTRGLVLDQHRTHPELGGELGKAHQRRGCVAGQALVEGPRARRDVSTQSRAAARWNQPFVLRTVTTSSSDSMQAPRAPSPRSD